MLKRLPYICGFIIYCSLGFGLRLEIDSDDSLDAIRSFTGLQRTRVRSTAVVAFGWGSPEEIMFPALASK